MRIQPVLFDDLVPAGTDGRIYKRALPYPGVLRKITITFYPGQQKTLQITPYMLKAPDILMPLAGYAGDRSYFSGDENTYEINLAIPFGPDDLLCVKASNVSSPAQDYEMYVLYEVQFGGMS